MVEDRASRLMTQMRRGSVELCVLALLSERDRYGFEIAKEMANADGLVTSEGTIYPLLARLRNEGLVDTRWSESPDGPPRRYYRLSKDGSDELRLLTEQWRRFRDAVDSIVIDGKKGR